MILIAISCVKFSVIYATPIVSFLRLIKYDIMKVLLLLWKQIFIKILTIFFLQFLRKKKPN